MKVGDIVYLGETDRKGIEEDKIKKIGIKYIELENSRSKFIIDGLIENSKYGIVRKIYLSKQELEDIQELNFIAKYIRKLFIGHGTPSFTLDQLRRINNILNE